MSPGSLNTLSRWLVNSKDQQLTDLGRRRGWVGGEEGDGLAEGLRQSNCSTAVFREIILSPMESVQNLYLN